MGDGEWSSWKLFKELQGLWFERKMLLVSRLLRPLFLSFCLRRSSCFFNTVQTS